MAKQVTFKVSRKGVEPLEVNFSAPENLTDPRWEELGVNDEAKNDIALDSLIIKIQGVARSKLDDGAEAVQKAVTDYRYGQRGSGVSRVKVVKVAADTAKKAKFTPEQIELLKAAGVTFEEAA